MKLIQPTSEQKTKQIMEMASWTATFRTCSHALAFPRFGFASLHNVNRPSKQRDEMPSFFVAVPGLEGWLQYVETWHGDQKTADLRKLWNICSCHSAWNLQWKLVSDFEETARLFSPDTVLPLDKYVLSTEAHPVPILGRERGLDVSWHVSCELSLV